MSTNIHRKDNGVIIVEPRGRIVGTNVNELQKVLLAEIQVNDAPRILINFQQTMMMGSSGLGVLIQAYKSVKRKKGRMGVMHLNRRIKNLLVLSRLTLFEHFDTETEVVAALNESSGFLKPSGATPATKPSKKALGS